MSLGFRRKARLELWDAIDWYERRRPGLGAEFDQAINLLLQQIVSTPKRFRHLPPLVGRARLKRFPYFVYFTEVEDAIQVIAIIHVRRGAEWIERRLME
jgi:plasmid stabilization system protein ParE